MHNPARFASRVLVLVSLIALGCSGGSSGGSSRVDALAGGAPGREVRNDAGAAQDARDRDAHAGDAPTGSVKQDAGSNDVLPAADAPVQAQSPYAQGTPFGRLQYDLLGKMYGEWVCAVLPQANGQVILVGTANTTWVSKGEDIPENAITLVRLNADGKMDTTFGTAGKTVFTMSPHPVYACRAAAQTKDGKIIVAGDRHASGSTFTNNLNHDFLVARFNQDGTLDKTFGSEGVTTTNIHATPDDAGGDDLAWSLALLDDGRIVVGGKSVGSERGGPALVRYTADGALDPTFGTGGTVLLEKSKINFVFPNVCSLVVVSDGSLVAGLSFAMGWQDTHFALVRILPDGTLDPAFATAGVRLEDVVQDHVGQIELRQLSRDPDGKLVVLLATASNDGQQAVLYRYTAQGVLDGTFGTAGRVAVPTTAMGAWEALFMLRPADGSILVGLGATGMASYGRFDMIHVSANGVYDDVFGELSWNWDTGTGAVWVPFITNAGICDNGDIVVGGHITTKNDYNTDTIVLHLKKNAGP